MRFCDHFHCTYKDGESKGEVEGGWTGVPADWEKKTDEERREWIQKLVIDWGMPEGATIKSFVLCG